MDRRGAFCGSLSLTLLFFLGGLFTFFFLFLFQWYMVDAYEDNNCLILNHTQTNNGQLYYLVTKLQALDEPWVNITGSFYGVYAGTSIESWLFQSANPVGSIHKCWVNICRLTDRSCLSFQVDLATLILPWWPGKMWIWFAASIGLFLTGLYFLGGAIYLSLPSSAALIPYLGRLYCCCPIRHPRDDGYDELL